MFLDVRLESRKKRKRERKDVLSNGFIIDKIIAIYFSTCVHERYSKYLDNFDSTNSERN